jgi:hypothetical protein
MHIARLIYASQASSPISMGDMVMLMEQARRFNSGLQITGMLAFSRDHFMQVLEGAPDRVNMLYHRIARDPRHHTLSLIDYSAIDGRAFSDWNMAALDVAGMSAARRATTLMKYGPSDRFEPHSMSAASALQLLTAWRYEIQPGLGAGSPPDAQTVRAA